MTLQPTSQPKTKAAGLTRHQLAMAAIGVPAIFLGTLAIIWNKYVHDSPHFKSWHGVSSDVVERLERKRLMRSCLTNRPLASSQWRGSRCKSSWEGAASGLVVACLAAAARRSSSGSTIGACSADASHLDVLAVHRVDE